MSVIRYHHLSCDECLTWIDERTAEEARTHASREGWPHIALANEHGRPLDFCTEACKAAYFAAKDC
ncbi:hypothetical protein [Rhodococcus sp. BS-15]|uniref:hypothetical protein n=1 Tax=Rhodococcus sp. BS-15 TaxID=1304954 RepID=UPI000FFB972B|nr:hypothetical protein [Rhodococcus sp. BS-15]